MNKKHLIGCVAAVIVVAATVTYVVLSKKETTPEPKENTLMGVVNIEDTKVPSKTPTPTNGPVSTDEPIETIPPVITPAPTVYEPLISAPTKAVLSDDEWYPGEKIIKVYDYPGGRKINKYESGHSYTIRKNKKDPNKIAVEGDCVVWENKSKISELDNTYISCGPEPFSMKYPKGFEVIAMGSDGSFTIADENNQISVSRIKGWNYTLGEIYDSEKKTSFNIHGSLHAENFSALRLEFDDDIGYYPSELQYETGDGNVYTTVDGYLYNTIKYLVTDMLKFNIDNHATAMCFFNDGYTYTFIAYSVDALTATEIIYACRMMADSAKNIEKGAENKVAFTKTETAADGIIEFRIPENMEKSDNRYVPKKTTIDGFYSISSFAGKDLGITSDNNAAFMADTKVVAGSFVNPSIITDENFNISLSVDDEYAFKENIAAYKVTYTISPLNQKAVEYLKTEYPSVTALQILIEKGTDTYCIQLSKPYNMSDSDFNKMAQAFVDSVRW